MQCPNCGKEALNVNGKYVCLDCGIEVASPGAASNDPQPQSQVSHSFDQESPADSTLAAGNDLPDAMSIDSSPVDRSFPENSGTSNTTSKSDAIPPVSNDESSFGAGQSIPAASEPPVSGDGDAGTVKDYYLDALKESADDKSGSYDFDAKQPEDSAAVSNLDSAVQPNVPQVPDQSDTIQQETTAEPIENTLQSSMSQQEPAAVPAEEPQAQIAPPEPVDTSINQATEQKEPVSLETEEQKPGEPISDQAQPSGPDYFQPQAVDITPNSQARAQSEPPQTQDSKTTAQDGFDAYSTPSGIGLGEPVVDELANQNQPKVTEIEEKKLQEAAPALDTNSAKEQPVSVSSETFEAPVPLKTESVMTPPAQSDASKETDSGANLDELLDQYSGQASTVPTQTQPVSGPPVQPSLEQQNYHDQAGARVVDTVRPSSMPMPPSNQNQGMNQAMPEASGQPMGNDNISSVFPQNNQPMPGAGNIPTAESVFGGEPLANDTEPLVAENPPKKKKTGLFIGIGVAAFLLVIGMIYLGMTLSSARNKKNEQPTQQDLMFSLSDKVSKAMDSPQNVAVTFDQSIDFSKATPKTPEGGDTNQADVLKLLFAGPVTAKGTWLTDKDSNLSVDANFTNIAEKKIYITADKATYVQGADGQWSKSDGMQITQIPSLYSAQNKGGLFYLTKVNALKEIGSETIDGKLYKKIQIDPKPDLVEAVLSGSNAALAETKYDNVNPEKLEIMAWIDDDGKIFRVTAKGDISVTSDLYEGTVSIKSEAKYEYKDTQIKKPEGV